LGVFETVKSNNSDRQRATINYQGAFEMAACFQVARVSRLINRCVLLGFAVLAGSAAGQNTLTLNIDSAKSVIKKELYGGLLEQLGRQIYDGLYVGRTGSTIPNENGVRKDVIDLFKEAGVGCLQWPGGCYAENYKWTDGTGPVANRPGGDAANGFGTDEFVQFCKLVGCEPYLTTNFRAGSAAQNAAWIAYCMAKPDWNIRYWGIGNEPWGGCGYTMTVNDYMNKYDQFCTAIPDSSKKKLVKISSSGTWLTGNTPVMDSAWMDAIMKRETGNTEGISWHSYTCVSWSNKGSSINFTASDYYSIVYRAFEVESFIRKTIPIMDKYDPNVTVGLMVDEWGDWLNSESGMGTFWQQNTLRDAMSTAIHLNAFNNCCKRVKMGLIAQPLNVIHSLLLTNTGTNSIQMIKTPTFYVYKMYKVHQNARSVPAVLQSNALNQAGFTFPALTQSTSIDSTGTIHCTIGNVDLTNSQDLQISLNSSAKYDSVSGQIITASTMNALNNFGTPEQVNIQPFAKSNFTLSGTTLNVKVPAKSIILLTLVPSITDIKHFKSQSDQGLRVTPVQGYGINISGTVTHPTPVKVSLYGVDGRSLDRSFSTTIKPGSSIVWKPGTGRIGAGSYLVRVEANGVVKTERMVLSR
jgi:alpha-N-arabinofuranosidase